MRTRWLTIVLVAFALFQGLWTATARAQSREEATVRSAERVLQDIMRIRFDGIPRSLLEEAEGVAIIPRVLKGSFVVGARFGRGVLLVRDEEDGWQPPHFITLTGGNLGWQIGVNSTDIILVFRTRTSIEELLSGTLTLGADIAAAAGPVGRHASAGTDLTLQSEILSYSRSRGLFAGVAIDGSVIKVDNAANMAYYGTPDPRLAERTPPSAERLMSVVAGYADPGHRQPIAAVEPHREFRDRASAVRAELARVAGSLLQILPADWQAYLALPPEVFRGGPHPHVDQLQQCVNRYEQVNQDPQYGMLTRRPEFQRTRDLLQQYRSALTNADRQLTLPAPPGSSSPWGPSDPDLESKRTPGGGGRPGTSLQAVPAAEPQVEQTPQRLAPLSPP